MAWVRISPVSAVPEGKGAVVDGGRPRALAVFIVNGQPRVLENECPHRQGDLGAGDVFEGKVYCPLHAWPFDLESGRSPTHPEACVKAFPARVEQGWIEADLGDVDARGSPPELKVSDLIGCEAAAQRGDC